MATIDIGGAGVGALLIAGRILDTLVAKGILTDAERAEIIKESLGATSGDMGKSVKGAFQIVFPGLPL